jgi:hypothetical protein
MYFDGDDPTSFSVIIGVSIDPIGSMVSDIFLSPCTAGSTLNFHPASFFTGAHGNRRNQPQGRENTARKPLKLEHDISTFRLNEHFVGRPQFAQTAPDRRHAPSHFPSHPIAVGAIKQK